MNVAFLQTRSRPNFKSALEEALVFCERAASQEMIDLDEVAAARHKIPSLMHDRNYDLANES